ncbi:MAG: tetratricopeptide repeat protein [Firmicutes bacterium]|nr:tetratricopeptide repeat protein [Bacillota bacterium]
MEHGTLQALNRHQEERNGNVQEVDVPSVPDGDGAGGQPGSEPEFFRVLWEAADMHLQEERYQDAAKALERLLSQKRRIPAEQRPRVQRRLAAAYMHQALRLKPLSGNRRAAVQAVGLLEKAAQVDGSRPEPMYWCGVIYRSFDMWEKAVDSFRRALETDPGHTESRLELIWILLRLGKTDEARETLAGAPSAPRDELTEWHWQRMEAALRLSEGRVLDAFDAYPAFLPDGAPAAGWCRELVHLAEAAGAEAPAAVLRKVQSVKDSVEMLLGNAPPGEDQRNVKRLASLTGHLRALDAWERGDEDAAIVLWRVACETDPNDARYRQHLVRALIGRGRRAWAAGRMEEAVSAWEEANRLGGANPPLMHHMALAYERLNRWDEANRCWEEYLRMRPDGEGTPARPAVLLAMASNAIKAGDRDGADKLLAQWPKSAASNPELLLRYGLLQVHLGNGPKAVTALARVLKSDPENDIAVKALLHAVRLSGVNQLQLVLDLKDAVARLPRDSWMFRHWRHHTFDLGRRMFESSALDQAMELFASVLLIDPGDIDGWVWAGTVHMKQGNRRGAEDCFSEAIRLNPKRQRTYLDLGARFLASGDRDRAMAYFHEAVEASPGPEIHVTIGELCAELGVPDMAEQHFRASLSGGQGAEPLLVRAIFGLVRTGYEDRVRPFLEEAYRQVPESIQVRVLLAVQHLRHEEWVPADAELQQAERMARERQADGLLEHISFFRKTLILLRTVGKIDEKAFLDRVRSLLEEWLRESAGSLAKPEPPPAEPVETLLAQLPDPVAAEPGEAAVPDGNAAPEPPLAESGNVSLFFKLNIPPAAALTFH